MNVMLKKEMRLSALTLTYLFIGFGAMTMLPGYPILCGVFFITLGIYQSFQSVCTDIHGFRELHSLCSRIISTDAYVCFFKPSQQHFIHIGFDPVIGIYESDAIPSCILKPKISRCRQASVLLQRTIGLVAVDSRELPHDCRDSPCALDDFRNHQHHQ